MRKRSKTVALTLLGAAAFTVAGCREETVDAQAFPDLDSCKYGAEQTGEFTVLDCEIAFREAEALHVETAPRYDSLEVCEQEYGAGNCGSEAQATEGGGGSGSIFMPLLAGYLLGNMLGGRGVASQPLYRTSDGRYTNPAGSSTYSSNSGRAQVSPQAFNKAPTTAGRPPLTQTKAASRGGFGSSSTTRSFGG